MEKQNFTKDQEIKKVSKNLPGMIESAEQLEILNQETRETAVTILGELKKVKSLVNDRKLFYTKPLKQMMTDYNTMANNFLEPIKKADQLIRGKLIKYDDYLEDLKRKEEEKLKKKTEKAIQENKPLPVAKPIDTTKKVKSENNTFTVTKVRKFEITDEMELPRQFLTPDLKKIGKLVKAGIEEIPGVRIWTEKSSMVR